MADDDGDSWHEPEPLAPERPSLENAIFVVLGMLVMLYVLVHLYLLFI